MARRSFVNLDRRKVMWLVIALALIAMSIVLRWPTLALTVFIPGSNAVLFTLLIAYSIASFFWFRLNPIKSKLFLVLLALIWPIADELLAYIIRFISAEERIELTDLLGTYLGVNMGWYVSWSLHSHVGPGERIARKYWKYVKRRALNDKVYHRLYFQRFVRQACISVALSAASSIIILWFVWKGRNGQIILQPFYVAPYIWIIILLFLVVSIGLPLRFNRIWLIYEAAPDYSKQMPCFNCDTSCIELEFDENGWGNCSKCREQAHHGQWIAPHKLQMKNTSKQVNLLTQCCKYVPVITLVFGMYLFSIFADFTGLRIGFFIVVILTHVVILHGFFHSFMSLISKRYKYQHIECRECAYELKGILLDKGVGTCPECGLRFARIIEDEQPIIE